MVSLSNHEGEALRQAQGERRINHHFNGDRLLEEIIKNAEERLWLISPFLKVTPRIKQLLEDVNRLKIDSRVIYGKNELHPEENNWLKSMTSIRTSFCKDLHAKCFMNESEVLLTSMNLYEFSQINNYEMGILVSRKEDPDLYEEIYLEARRILRASEEIQITVARVPSSENGNRQASGRDRRPKSALENNKPQAGFCIRCKSDLAADPSKPYCDRCFRSWNRYKNPEYEEKFCHICGTEHEATLQKPVCRPCYSKYRLTFEFAAT